MKFLTKVFLASTLMFVCAGHVSAELVLNTSVGGNVLDSRGGTAPNFVVQAGGSVTLDIYVTQRGTYQPVPGFNFPDFRLSSTTPSMGVQPNGVGAMLINFTAQVDGGGAASGLTFGTPTFGAGFIDDGNTGTNAQGFGLSGFATNVLAGTTLTPVFAAQNFSFDEASRTTVNDNSVRLGSVTVDLTAATAPGNYIINFSNPGEGNSFILGSSAATGALVQPFGGIARITVTAVPEPSTFAILGLLGGAIAYRQRRRNKGQRENSSV
jgi:hypothetical protein